MTQLNTQYIKTELESKGFSNIKRISKKKDSLGQVLRVFETSSGLIQVTSDKTDSLIISIEPFKTPDTNLKKCHLQNLVELSMDELDKCIKPYAQSSYEKIGLLKILAIPQLSYYEESHVSHDFESFILIYDDKKILLDSFYGESQSLSLTPEHICSKELRGLFVETDFDLEMPECWVEMIIPEGSFVYFSSPEYSKLICLSPDFTQGITTSGFGNEPSVIGSNKQLQKLDMLSLTDDDTGDLVSNYRKKKLQYDFVHYHM